MIYNSIIGLQLIQWREWGKCDHTKE